MQFRVRVEPFWHTGLSRSTYRSHTRIRLHLIEAGSDIPEIEVRRTFSAQEFGTDT